MAARLSPALLSGSVLLLVIVTLGYAIVQVRNDYQQWHAERTALLADFARRTEGRTERYFESWQMVFGAVAGTECIRERTPRSCQDLFSRLGARFPAVVNLAAADRSGSLFASSVTLIPGASLAQQPFFKALAAGAPHYIFEPHTGPLSGERVLGIAVPLRDPAGRFDGLIGISVRFDQLAQSWKSLTRPPGTGILIIDRSRSVAYAGPSRPEWIGRTAESIGRGALGAQVEGPVRFRADGVIYNGQMTHGNQAEWSLIAFRDGSSDVSGFFREHLSIIFMVLPILLLGMATLGLFAKNRNATRLILERDRQLVQDQQQLESRVEELTAALRESHALLMATERLAGIGGFRWDIGSDGLAWSGEVYRMFGRDPRDGAPTVAAFIAAVHPGDRSRVQRAVAAAVAGTRPYDVEFRIIRPDGCVRFILSQGEVARDEAGKAVRMTGTSHDITERKLAEEDLRKSEERFHRYFELGLVGMAITLPCRGIAEVNDKICEILGFERAELQQKSWPELTHPEDLAADVAQLGRVVAGDIDGYTLDKRFIRKDGEVVYMTISVHCMRAADGAVDYFVSLLQDITEGKRAEEKLRILSHAVEQSPTSIVITDRAGNIVYVNPHFEQLTGYAKAEVLGRNTRLLKSGTTPAETYRALWKTISEGHEWRGELCNRKKNGELFWEHAAISGLRDDNGQLAHYIAAKKDITESKRLEEAHLQAQKLESLGTLAGGIAHDFNNILAAIQGNADLAAEDVGPDHIAAESLEEIRKASVRASELVRRIMAFGRPEEARQVDGDLGKVVDEVLKLLRSTLPAGISLRKEFARDTPRVLADAGQIHEAIVNLTTNAAYAIGPRAGSIEYRLESVQVGEELSWSVPGIKAGRYARLTVTDSGFGMDAATMQRIFDAFYTTKPVGEGTGLGLSMVHGIMKSHGGAVTVESAPGKGSSFHLYFPAAQGVAQELAGQVAGKVGSLPGQRVLYVDDEEALVSLASRVLSRLGHSITGFTDPKEALKSFQSCPQDFDIVVTDLSMPGMSGFDLAREILAVRPGMPVLMTTGYIRAEDEGTARHIGISELILKPIKIDELGRILDRLFRSDNDAKSIQ